MEVYSARQLQELRILHDIKKLLTSMELLKSRDVLASDDLYPCGDLLDQTVRREVQSSRHIPLQFSRSSSMCVRDGAHRGSRGSTSTHYTSDQDSSSTSPSCHSSPSKANQRATPFKVGRLLTANVRRHESLPRGYQHSKVSILNRSTSNAVSTHRLTNTEYRLQEKTGDSTNEHYHRPSKQLPMSYECETPKAKEFGEKASIKPSKIETYSYQTASISGNSNLSNTEELGSLVASNISGRGRSNGASFINSMQQNPPADSGIHFCTGQSNAEVQNSLTSASLIQSASSGQHRQNTALHSKQDHNRKDGSISTQETSSSQSFSRISTFSAKVPSQSSGSNANYIEVPVDLPSPSVLADKNTSPKSNTQAAMGNNRLSQRAHSKSHYNTSNNLSFYPSIKTHKLYKNHDELSDTSAEGKSNNHVNIVSANVQSAKDTSFNSQQTTEQEWNDSSIEALLDGRSLFACSSTSPLYFIKPRAKSRRRMPEQTS